MEHWSFEDFAGNEEVIRRITKLIDENRLPHAVIIEGEAGLGKRTLAGLIACAAVCVSKEKKPCKACSGCIKAYSGSHPDISVIEGTGKLGAIPVDVIRKIRGDAYIVPSEAEKKVFILCNADNTGEAAQNAFLKVFEEPPKAAIFIITCVSGANLLETIRSRAVTFRLSPVSVLQAVQRVKKILPDKDEEEIYRAADICGGNIGKCIAGLSDDSFIRIRQTVQAMAEALISPKEAEIAEILHRLEKDRGFAVMVIKNFMLTVADATSLKYGGNCSRSGNPEAAALLARNMNMERLLYISAVCENAVFMIERFVGMPLCMTETAAKLRNLSVK